MARLLMIPSTVFRFLKIMASETGRHVVLADDAGQALQGG